MNKKMTKMAASLLAAGALFACISMATRPSENRPAPLNDHDPIILAKDNTLAKTPDSIQQLVQGLDIDVRNSAYLILQEVRDNEDYKWDEGNGSISYFVLGSIIDPMGSDRAIGNILADDVDACLQVNGPDSDCWKIYMQGSPTWKARVLDKIYASPNLQNVLYNWIKPELIRVVHGFNETKMAYLKGAFDHMIDYTASYNHQAEKEFYTACINDNDPDVFTTGYRVEDMAVDYFGAVVNPYRRLETWVFRRVEEGSMTAAEINVWLKRLRKDLDI